MLKKIIGVMCFVASLFVSMQAQTLAIDIIKRQIVTDEAKSGWIYQASSGDGDSLHFVHEKIVESSQRTIKFWAKSITFKDKTLSQEISATTILFETTCDGKIKALQSTKFDGEGKVVSSSIRAEEWEYIIPNSISEAFSESVCSGMEAVSEPASPRQTAKPKKRVTSKRRG